MIGLSDSFVIAALSDELALQLPSEGAVGREPRREADHLVHLGFDRIVVSEIEAPNMLVNLV